jgi:uncharacterized membrane protein YjjP (DUF1212 family)
MSNRLKDSEMVKKGYDLLLVSIVFYFLGMLFEYVLFVEWNIDLAMFFIGTFLMCIFLVYQERKYGNS